MGNLTVLKFLNFALFASKNEFSSSRNKIVVVFFHKLDEDLCGKIKFSDSFYLFKDRFEYNEFMPYAEFIEIYKKVDINLVPLADNNEVDLHLS